MCQTVSSSSLWVHFQLTFSGELWGGGLCTTSGVVITMSVASYGGEEVPSTHCPNCPRSGDPHLSQGSQTCPRTRSFGDDYPSPSTQLRFPMRASRSASPASSRPSSRCRTTAGDQLRRPEVRADLRAAHALHRQRARGLGRLAAGEHVLLAVVQRRLHARPGKGGRVGGGWMGGGWWKWGRDGVKVLGLTP